MLQKNFIDNIIEKVLTDLHRIHKLNILHSDLKKDNIAFTGINIDNVIN